jgi:hypothetical protein
MTNIFFSDRKLKLSSAVFLSALLLVVPFGAPAANAAGGAYIVDDTSLINPGSCQVEAWAGVGSSSSHRAAIAPGCTFSAFPHAEPSITFERERINRNSTSYVTPELKTRILPKEEYGLGFGATIGTRYDSSDSRSDRTNIKGLFSVDASDRTTFNANLGYERHHRRRDNDAIWGVGADIGVYENTDMIVEVFGSSSDHQKTGFQAGLRPSFMNGNVNLDVIAGRHVTEGSTSWLTVGTRVGF